MWNTGLEISSPTSTAEVVQKTSVQCTKLLVSSIRGKGTFDISAHVDCVNTARKVSCKEQQMQQSEHFKDSLGLCIGYEEANYSKSGRMQKGSGSESFQMGKIILDCHHVKSEIAWQ